MPQIGIIILENASRTYSMGFSNIAALNNAHRGYTNHEGTSAPSLPDYVAITTGGFSNTGGHFGGNPNGSDSGSVGFEGSLNSIFSQLIAAGKSWKTYEESVTAAGYNAWSGAGGLYGARHCPGAFFSYTKAAGTNHGNGRYDFDELARDITNKTLPDFFIITPNIVNDGHAVSGGTNWTPTNQWVVNGNGGLFPGMTALINGLRADGVVVLTTDNIPHADTSAPITGTGVVYCVACGPNITNGAVNTYSNHFSLLKAVQSAFGVGALTTGVDANYTSATAMDLGVSSTPSAPSISSASITGTAQEGQTLTASATISGNPTPTVTYKWHNLGSTTSLGTASTYQLTAADVGNQLEVDITASNGVPADAHVTAGPTSAVTATGGGGPANSVTTTFAVNSTNSIGACDDGHTWDILQGATTQFNVSGGFLNITAVAGNAPIADIHGYSHGDEEVLMRYEFTSLAAGALQSIGAAVRMTDPQNYDRAIIEQTTTGTTILRVQKQIANVNTDIIASTTITAQAANTKYWLRFRVVSGTYFAKVWADGSSEPAGWTAQATDPNFNSNPGNLTGSVGIRLQCLAGNTNLATYKIDRFSSTVPSNNVSTITYQWSIDGSAFSNTGNSGNDLHETLATLSPGYHVFKVQPIDSLAGSGPISTYVWKVGTGSGTLSAPVLTSATDGIGTDLLIVDAKTTNTTLILNWTQDIGSDVYISLNGGTSYQGPFTSPHTFLNMPVGATNIVLQERDSSGHVSPNTTFSYTVLQLGPTMGPGSGIYSKQLALQGIAGSTVNQTIYVKATDTNALPASIIVQRTISIQIPVASTPPGVGILSPTDGDLVTTADDSVQVVVEATNANDTIATVQLTIDGSTFVDCVQQLDPNQWIGTIIIPFSVTSTITAVATDATDGLVSSDSVTVTSTVSGGGGGGGGGGGFAFFNKPVPIEVFIMDHSQNDVGVILPQDIRYTEQLNQPPTITFGINLQDSMAKKIRIDPNTHDWRLERNKVPIGAGILAQSGVQIDTQSRTLTLQGEGWLGYFSRQYMLYDPLAEITKQNLTFVNEDIFNVARSVIDSVIGGPNSIPITYDHSLSGITVTQQFLASDLTDLLTIITDLGGQVQGFDFEIDPFCHFKMYSPQKGTYSNLILEYGRNIEQIQYTNPGIKANRVNAVGSGTSSSQTVALKQNALSQKVARLYTDVAQFSNLRDYNQIGGLASAELNLDIQDQVTMVVTSRPVPGENQYALASVGDWVKVKFDLEYVSVDGFFRMTQRTFMPDNDGNEIIQYQFSPNTINVGQ